MLRSEHKELRNSLVKLGWMVLVGDMHMQPNTETSHSLARAVLSPL